MAGTEPAGGAPVPDADTVASLSPTTPTEAAASRGAALLPSPAAEPPVAAAPVPAAPQLPASPDLPAAAAMPPPAPAFGFAAEKPDTPAAAVPAVPQSTPATVAPPSVPSLPPFGFASAPPAVAPPADRPVQLVEPSAPPHRDASAGTVDTAMDEHAAHPMRRRRRSATLLPPLPSPTDVPEDAVGRVAIQAIVLPADLAAVATSGTGPTPAAATATATPTAGGGAPAASASGAAAAPAPADIPAALTAPADSLQAWVPVAVLGVAMLVAFIVGVLVTR